METQDQAKTEYSSGAGCLTRLYWMFAGNAALAVSIGLLIDRHPKSPPLLDAVCLLLLASFLCVRYIDIRYFKGETGDNSALATMDDCGSIPCSFRSDASAYGWRSVCSSPCS